MHHRLYRVLLLGMMVLALDMGGAQAAPFTPELEADYAFAEEWWGAVPTGCSSIDRELVPMAQIEASGRATQPRAGDPPISCVMLIAEEPHCYEREVVMHEYGHLLGFGHSTDPTSIMYPALSGTLCREEREAVFHKKLREEIRRCWQLRPGRHRRECWRGIKQERRALEELFPAST